jgi:hypothetical protein
MSITGEEPSLGRNEYPEYEGSLGEVSKQVKCHVYPGKCGHHVTWLQTKGTGDGLS